MMSFRYHLLLLCTVFSLLFSCTWEANEGAEQYDLFYLERDGSTMPTHVHGNIDSKVFIVILHGGPGGNGLEYRPGVFSEVVEKNYAVVYFDQRGQGMSQGHYEVDQSTIDNMVEDVNALAKVLKHKYGDDASLFLMGHSWGGTLGTAFMSTKDYQQAFKGWIEVDGAHDFYLLQKSQVELVKEVGQMQINNDEDVDFWKDYIDEVEKIDTNKIEEDSFVELNGLSFEAEEKLTEVELIRDGFEDFLDVGLLFKSLLFSVNPITNFVSGSLTNYTLTFEHDLLQTDLSQQLKNITIPTLIMWGKYDFVVPAELGNQAYNLISSTEKELIIFDQSGHSPMSNQGKEFAAELLRFIDKYK
jgi:pimeloyl-ACP methyl ester carboxylesterase